MTLPRWIILEWAILVLAAPLPAQSLSTAALEGRVIGAGGEPLVGAVVTVSNASTGERWQTVTRGRGRFGFELLSAGGPYTLEARAIGYQPAGRAGIYLSLGERRTADLTLSPAGVQLEAVIVQADTGRGGGAGPSTTLSDSLLRRLPIRGRDLTQLALLAPEVTRSRSGGLSFAGQNDRLNGLTIDGATNNDLLGGSSLGGVGTPGQDLGVRTVPPEAIQELQVLSAPFDVRFGNFAGGLVNAITRSGSNRFEVSLFGYYSGRRLIGHDPDGGRGMEFDAGEFGLTAAGPLRKDRAAFFLEAGFERNNLPQTVPLITPDTAGGRDSAAVGIRWASARRLREVLSRTYGVDAGSVDPYPLRVSPRNLFAKLTFQLGLNSRLDFSHNYAHSEPDVLTFAPSFSCRERGFYCLTSRAFQLPVTVHETRLGWTSAVGAGFENELFLARLAEAMQCLASPSAGVLVSADEGILSAGGSPFCAGTSVEQRLLELTDNLTFTSGAHRATVGTHLERVALPTADGLAYLFHNEWYFESLDSLELGLPSFYEATIRNPSSASGPLSDLLVHQLGFYLQDQWRPNSRFTVSAGLRVDVPFFGRRPAANQQLRSALGIDNTRTPSGNLLWSPRLSLTFGFGPDARSFLRAGAGIFAGRPPYKWFDQVYTHTGLEAVGLTCAGAAVPSFVLALDRQPTACADPGVPVVPFVNYFDPGFRFPRNLKLVLGIDHRFSSGFVGTLDLLLTRGLNQFNLRDANLRPLASPALGEARRPLYGVIDPETGTARPGRISAEFGPVLEVGNSAGDRSVSLTVKLQRRLSAGAELTAAYTYTSARDRFSATEDVADDNLGLVPVDGSLEHRRLAPSEWSVPHKLLLMGAFNLPLDVRVALIYTGVSGVPYSYVVGGDANADGFGDIFESRFNDLVYVPRDAGDISLTNPAEYPALEAVIRHQPCLREARGRLLRRNACRNAWVHLTEARIAKRFPWKDRRGVELLAEAFNLLRFLDADWGVVRETGSGSVPLLELTGYDPPRGRGVYRVLPAGSSEIVADASRWRVRLGARLTLW